MNDVRQMTKKGKIGQDEQDCQDSILIRDWEDELGLGKGHEAKVQNRARKNAAISRIVK